jgi:uncharacterized membrane protein YbhN (UPF0104 family)
LPPVAALFLLVMQIVSAAVPSGPGFIGTYHAAVVAGLAVFDVAPELALSVAIVIHASFFSHSCWWACSSSGEKVCHCAISVW